MSFKPVTDETFEAEVLKTDTVNVVFFSAEWDAASQMMKKYLPTRLDGLPGDVKLFEMDVDKSVAYISKHRVHAVPSFLIFHKGEMVHQHAGAVNPGTFVEWILEHDKVDA